MLFIKVVVQSAGPEPFRQLQSAPVDEWLNVELSRLRLQDRFGRIPTFASKRLREMTDPEVSKLPVKLLHASTIQELFS